jgi:pentatricopeptide repeat protein
MMGIIKYTPVLILFIASIIDSIAILFKLYNKESFYNIYKFFIIQCVIKYIPLFLVWNTEIITKKNIKHTLIFIYIYMVYMYINVGSIKEVLKIYDRMLQASTSQNKEDQYPITALWNKLT